MRRKEFDDLRDFNHGGTGDCGDPESFGDGEFQALRGSEVDINDYGFVAVGAEERDAEVADWGGKGVSEGLEGGTEDVHYREVRERFTKFGSS